MSELKLQDIVSSAGIRWDAAAPEPPVLQPGELHLWATAIPEELDPETRERLLPLLNEEERAPYERLRLARDRDLHLAAHAHLRQVLSQYADDPPEAWRFTRNRYDRPFVENPSLRGRLYFSLTHTAGLAVTLVSTIEEAGVDSECLGRKVGIHRVARGVFAPSEYADLLALAEEAQRERFLQLWTLKEAYIKARGMGMALPLQRFAYRFEGGAVALEVDPEIDPNPAPWRAATFQLGPEHQVALAVRHPEQVPLRLKVAVHPV
ncbi:MAG: 4'-phosphopantetheinyl transferase family protein [Armatimonadota bacterium]